MGDKLEPLWLEFQLNPRRRSEIEGILQILADKHLGRNSRDKSILLEPPPPEVLQGEYPLGTVLYQGKEFGHFALREKELLSHLGIWGRTGSGKSNVGFLIARSLMEKSVPILVFDWKRNYRDLMQFLGPDELRIYTVGRNITPFAFNPLIPPKGTNPATWLKKLIDVLCHVYWLGEGVAFLLQKAIDAVYEQYGVHGGNPEAYPRLQDVADWLAKAKVRGREAQWMDSAKRAIGTLCYGNISSVINRPQSIDIESLLTTNAVLELDALTSSDKTFFVETLLLWIHHFRLQEQKRETLKHIVVIEEAHNVLLKRKQGKENVMDVTLREIRELGEGLILIDQHPSLISVPSLGNTHTTIAMNLKHGADVAALSQAMLLRPDEKEYLGRLPVGHAVIRLQGRWYRPFLVKFPLVSIEKGKVTDEELVKQNLSHSESEGEIRRIQQSKAMILPTLPSEKVREEETELLKDVLENKTSGVVERYSRLGFSSYFGDKVKSGLLAKGLIESTGIATSHGLVRVLTLTQKGREHLQALGLQMAPSGRGGIEHEYWKEKVSDFFKQLGYEVESEKSVGGGKTIDLVGTKGNETLAVEVETGNSDVLSNVQKCDAARFKKLLVLVTKKSVLPSVSRIIESSKHPVTLDIRVEHVQAFLAS